MSDDGKVVPLFGRREPGDAWVSIHDSADGGYLIQIGFSDSPPITAGDERDYAAAVDIARRKGALLKYPVLDFTMHAPAAPSGGDAA